MPMGTLWVGHSRVILSDPVVCLFVWGFVYARNQGPLCFTRYVQTRVLPGYTRPLEEPGNTGAGLTGVGDLLQYAKARGGVLTTGAKAPPVQKAPLRI